MSGGQIPNFPKRTAQQLNESERQGYWQHFVRNSLQYYKSGRFAVASGFAPVSGNLLHHAVEQMMKACLAHRDTLPQIKEYGDRKEYGHDLVKLWAEIKERLASENCGIPQELNEVVAALHRFELIRYPEKLIQEGASLSIGLFEVDGPPLLVDGQLPENHYVLMLPKIDRLIGFLVRVADINLEAFKELRSDQKAIEYYQTALLSEFGGRLTMESTRAPVAQGARR